MEENTVQKGIVFFFRHFLLLSSNFPTIYEYIIDLSHCLIVFFQTENICKQYDAKIMRIACGRVKNIVVKGENASYFFFVVFLLMVVKIFHNLKFEWFEHPTKTLQKNMDAFKSTLSIN